MQISKDEHEKERQRWATKIEDVEVRLMDAESFNSDMNQMKAELVSRQRQLVLY